MKVVCVIVAMDTNIEQTDEGAFIISLCILYGGVALNLF